MPKDSVFSMAFGFDIPRSVSQLTTDVQQLSKECNSCNSNFNELRKEIRETQSAPPQVSTKWITHLTKQGKKHKKTRITHHETKKEILRAFPCQVPNGKDDDTLVALAMNEILEIFSEAGENSKYSNGSFAKARAFCRLKDGQRDDSLARSQSHPTEHQCLHHFHPRRRHGHAWNMCKFLVDVGIA